MAAALTLAMSSKFLVTPFTTNHTLHSSERTNTAEALTQPTHSVAYVKRTWLGSTSTTDKHGGHATHHRTVTDDTRTLPSPRSSGVRPRRMPMHTSVEGRHTLLTHPQIIPMTTAACRRRAVVVRARSTLARSGTPQLTRSPAPPIATPLHRTAVADSGGGGGSEPSRCQPSLNRRCERRGRRHGEGRGGAVDGGGAPSRCQPWHSAHPRSHLS